MMHPIAGDPRRGEEHAGHLDDCSHEECKRVSHASRAAVRRARRAAGGQLRSAHEVAFLLVQRLGGEVELTAEELSGLDPAWELVSWPNPATDGLVVKCRKPPKESP